MYQKAPKRAFRIIYVFNVSLKTFWLTAKTSSGRIFFRVSVYLWALWKRCYESLANDRFTAMSFRVRFITESSTIATSAINIRLGLLNPCIRPFILPWKYVSINVNQKVLTNSLKIFFGHFWNTVYQKTNFPFNLRLSCEISTLVRSLLKFLEVYFIKNSNLLWRLKNLYFVINLLEFAVN